MLARSRGLAHPWRARAEGEAARARDLVSLIGSSVQEIILLYRAAAEAAVPRVLWKTTTRMRKAGQTKFKTCAVEYLENNGFTVKVVASSNHLGNNDMRTDSA